MVSSHSYCIQNCGSLNHLFFHYIKFGRTVFLSCRQSTLHRKPNFSNAHSHSKNFNAINSWLKILNSTWFRRGGSSIVSFHSHVSRRLIRSIYLFFHVRLHAKVYHVHRFILYSGIEAYDYVGPCKYHTNARKQPTLRPTFRMYWPHGHMNCFYEKSYDGKHLYSLVTIRHIYLVYSLPTVQLTLVSLRFF